MALTNLNDSEHGSIPRAIVTVANINYAGALGDVTLVPASAGKRIVLLSLVLGSPNAGQGFTLHSGSSATGDGIVFEETGFQPAFPSVFTMEKGICWTEPGSSLVLAPKVAGSTSLISGHLTYVEVV